MEQIRIIKEMREHDKETNRRTNEFIRPRWMVWENVPGAFSSNGGDDFRAVLEETARVADENAVIPRLAKGQKWTPAGCIMGDGWSIAWRVHDAQFWGVPQRRKRISLVADFGGGSAPEILFERKSVHGDFEESGNPREETPRDAGEGAAQTGRCLNGWDVQSKHIQPEHGIAEALYSGECRHGGGESYVMQTGRALSFQERAGKPGGGKGILIQNEKIGALSTLNNQSVCAEAKGFPLGFRAENTKVYDEKSTTICNGTRPGFTCGVIQAKGQAVVYGISAYDSNSMKSPNPNSGIYKAETARTLDLNGGSPACNQGGMAVVCLEGNGSRPSHHAVCFDARGNGNGQIAPTITGDHQDRITDYTAIAVGEVAASLCAQDGRGGVHSQRLADPEGNFVLEPVVASKASHFTHGIEGGVSDTLYASDYKEPQRLSVSIQQSRSGANMGKRNRGIPDRSHKNPFPGKRGRRMLEKEVIEILQKGMDELGQYGGELTIAYETAIGALNKQMPKRPYTSVIPYPYKRDETMVQCPACRRRLRTRRTMAKGDKFCPSCGQHIDWEGIDG